jgi:hypothetical protein
MIGSWGRLWDVGLLESRKTFRVLIIVTIFPYNQKVWLSIVLVGVHVV